jgi:hypothetical protein
LSQISWSLVQVVSETDLLSLKHGNPGKQLMFSVPFRWEASELESLELQMHRMEFFVMDGFLVSRQR